MFDRPAIYKKSNFVHIYKRPDDKVYALYNSLTLDVVYVNEKIKNAYLNNVEEFETCKCKEFAEQLAKNHFLLPSDSDFEETRMKHFRDQVSTNDIKMLCIILTVKCNFACKYCHLQNIEDRDSISDCSTITPEILKKGLEIYAEYSGKHQGPKDILLYGGEPLLAKKAIYYISDYIKEHADDFNGKVNVILITNGSFVDAEIAAFLKKNDIFVIVSVDGIDDKNDIARQTPNGEGTFKVVEKAVEILQQAGNKIGLSITVGKHNIDNIHGTVEKLLTKFKPIDFGLNSCLHPINGKENSFQIESEEAARSLIRCFKIAREKGFYAEQLFRRIRPFIYKRPRLKDCSSSGGRFVLTPYGTIGMCDSFAYTNDYCENVDGFDLDKNEYYPEWKELSPVNNADCLPCPALTICGGGCRYDAYYQSGRIDSLDLYRCKQAKLILEWLIWDLYDHLNRRIGKDYSLIVPKDGERKLLLENIRIKNEEIPMWVSNTYGEKI